MKKLTEKRTKNNLRYNPVNAINIKPSPNGHERAIK